MAGAGETGREPSPWTIDSLHERIIELFAASDRRHDDSSEALRDLLREVDRRYEQRFIAQENAVGLALTRVDKEFHEHIAQVRTETHAALEAADKAINKSESATEKRFESVNEFRAQLADQTRTFMPRTESISRHDRSAEQIEALVKAIADLRDRIQTQSNSLMPRTEAEQRILQNAEKVDNLDARHQKDVGAINSRLDLTAGRSNGLAAGWGGIVAAVTVAAAVVGAIIAIIIATAP